MLVPCKVIAHGRRAPVPWPTRRPLSLPGTPMLSIVLLSMLMYAEPPDEGPGRDHA